MKTSGILLIVNTVLLIVIWAFIGIKYTELPEIIPTHFDFRGNVDGESGKSSIWILPCIATFISLLFSILSKNPDSPLLNVPQSFRNKKTIDLYMQSLLFPIMLLFLDITVESILVAQGKQKELSNAVFYILGLLFIVIGVAFVKGFQQGKTQKSDK
ncbi:DUF1648 domain-containing protein [Chryseobacterium oryctis]|uniref:DUF1648 domain-containing protein n=1 Tax=Chryseobacterium oryctis TaxID=2952618 RepID=A0ABT3HKI5_9FLAO|nr:DUF1648 domain-containing protein [Chryseobacterium oryctis]MCW3160281.1 DUF1648 domain-containing protein [Chryseobacterium oryctis]